jgi:hypothetical protein
MSNEQEKVIDVDFRFSPKQTEALDALQGSDYDELLYGGAKGGGKSVFGCQWAALRATEIIAQCGLRPADDPPVIGFMGRKQSVDFNATTLETWKRFIPPELYTLKSSEKKIIIQNRAAIRYGGLDDSDTVKKFNSAEFCFYFLDQAEECSEQDVGLLRGTLRMKLNGIQPAYKGLLTANPAICWLKPAFISTPQPRTKFIRALPRDNPFIDVEQYEAQLRKAFGFNPALLKAYMEGSWDDLDQAFVVIPLRDVEKCIDNEIYDKRVVKKITVCDVSGEGEDETVIYDLENTKINAKSVEIYNHRDLMDTCGRIQAHAKINESNLICIDVVGIGAGVYSRLCEIFAGDSGMTVYGFDGRIKAPQGLDERTYGNYKTYAWFKAAAKFRAQECNIPRDQILASQLSSVTYHYSSGMVLFIDSKDVLKEKLRHSPDRADAYVMALDALDQAKPVEVRDRYARPTRAKYRLTPDAV